MVETDGVEVFGRGVDAGYEGAGEGEGGGELYAGGFGQIVEGILGRK